MIQTGRKQILQCRRISSRLSLSTIQSNPTSIPTDQYFPDRFSVAPMMDYTNRHQRKLQRWLSKYAVLYTEMVVTTTIIHTPHLDRHLEADFPLEHPLVLQLGGSDPSQMKKAAKIAYDYGYRQMNLNVGCPSDTVADAGCFGAALMLKPDLVSELVLAIQEDLPEKIPITVKCRIGINKEESYEFLSHFIENVSTKGKIQHFIIHARNAILGGKLTPDQNRKIPPLKYDYVYRLVQDFPHLFFTINGGVLTYEETEAKLSPVSLLQEENYHNKVHGVMIGRAVINNPFYWRKIDSRIFNATDPGISRRELFEKYGAYAHQQEKKYGRVIRSDLVKPLLNFFHGEYNGKLFRTVIAENARLQPDKSIDQIIMDSIQCLREETLDLR